jgi:DNA primase
MKRLLDVLGLDASFDYEKLERDAPSELDKVLELQSKKSARVVEFSRSLSAVTSYFNMHSTSLSNEARQYLYRRGLTDEIIRTLGIKEGLNLYPNKTEINKVVYDCRDYSGRIMVPSLQEIGMVSFYVARDYTNSRPNKYLNPPQELCYASEDVWNLGNIPKDVKDVIICEGVFTAIAVNVACNRTLAVATYGKSVAGNSNSEDETVIVTSQGEKLLSRNFETYYIFYDKDARESTLKTARYLYNRGANVKIVNILTDKYGEHADAADMTREEILYALRNAVVYDRFYEFDTRGSSI